MRGLGAIGDPPQEIDESVGEAAVVEHGVAASNPGVRLSEGERVSAAQSDARIWQSAEPQGVTAFPAGIPYLGGR